MQNLSFEKLLWSRSDGTFDHMVSMETIHENITGLLGDCKGVAIGYQPLQQDFVRIHCSQRVRRKRGNPVWKPFSGCC